MRIALTGNPNSGKTTMYNALTGRSEKVGNWAGVTVEKKEHAIKKNYCGSDMELTAVDLPGAYSMSPFTSEESITSSYVRHEHPDVIINIVDATNLSRSLFFTTQLLELGIPVVVALNKSDLNEKKGTQIDASDGMVQHMEMLPDDDPTDNKLRFVMMASSSKPLRGKMAEATVWNLFSYPTDTSRLHDEDAVVPGRFEFSFRLDYEDRSVVVCDQNTDVGLGWPLARLELSPVSVYLELDGLPENEMNPAFDTSIVLIGADGSRQEIVSDWDHEQTGEGIPSLSFSQDEKAVRILLQAIDPAQHAAVEVNGVTFPLENAAG